MHSGLVQQSAQHPSDINNPGNAALGIWAGNIADEPCSGCTPSQEVQQSDANATYWYTEIDSDWYMPCIASELYGNYGSAAWVGIGGSSYYDELVQAGSEADSAYNYLDYVNIYYVWWEYTSGDKNNPHITAQELDWNTGCGSGAHIWVRINGNNCYTIEWLNNGDWFNQCTGPSYSNHTAEAAVEIQQGALADYGTVKFQGVGITENTLGYQGFPNLWHDYSHMTDNGHVLAYTRPIVYDPNDSPYDDFNIDWNASS